MNRILALSFLGLFLLLSAAAQASQAAQALADKSDQMVVFFDEYAREIARFPASFGQARGAKVREGDRKTPEGDYMLSPADHRTIGGGLCPLITPAHAMWPGQDPRANPPAPWVEPLGYTARGAVLSTASVKVLVKIGRWGALR